MKELDDFLRLRGNLDITLLNDRGTKLHQVRKNLIVTAGKNWEAAFCGESPAAAMDFIGIGTGSTAAVVGDTALETELAGGSYARANTVRTVAANIISYSGLFTAGVGTGAITEYGLFNASTTGTMFSRVVNSVINVAAADSLQVIWHQTKG